MLQAKNLKKSFQDPNLREVLSDISISLSAGESVAICGKSGSGKTTLLHILGALEVPDSGSLLINGIETCSENRAKLRQTSIGFVFQAFNLLEDFTALDNVLMPASIARRARDPSHGLELLRLVDLESCAHTRARLLSGGERQRAAIARALCNDPALILADEPTGNLDSVNAERVADLLFSLTEKRKKGLILVTHDMDLAARCSRRLLLEDGRLHIVL